MTDIGHNSGIDDAALRSIFDRIVSIETAKRERAEEISDLYSEAKSQGFDVPALRETVKAYFIIQDAKKKAKAEQKAEIAAVYASALQMELF